MTVVVVGQDPKQFKEVSCRNCGARLRYCRDDVEHRSYTCCGKPESDDMIQCPQCTHWVAV